MPTAKDDRNYATICDDFADTTNDKAESAMLKKLADQWRRLANYKAKQHLSGMKETAN